MAGLAGLLDLGLRAYHETWELQHALHRAVRNGHLRETWIAVEHPPVVTLGRNAKRENVLLPPDLLAARGIALVEIERGGDVTYHGPGQLVVYPIRRLARFREIVPFVRALEESVIATCARFGIAAERWREHAGVWVGRDQICAIGLAVRQMTSMHGIAFNVCTALDYPSLINPCGLRDRGVTSLSKELGRPVTLDEVRPVLFEEFGRVFDLSFEPVTEAAVASLLDRNAAAAIGG
jgi:lipoyl(octanoyl) transferase